LCKDWEHEISRISDHGVSTCWVRTGVVLSSAGGALLPVKKSMRTGLGIPLGSGRQWFPWIHIDDLAQIFLFLLKHPALEGAFNGVSPHPVRNSTFTREVAKILKKIYIPIGIPAILLKLILGNWAVLSLEGTRISSKRIITAGYQFQFHDLELALRDLLLSNSGR